MVAAAGSGVQASEARFLYNDIDCRECGWVWRAKWDPESNQRPGTPRSPVGAFLGAGAGTPSGGESQVSRPGCWKGGSCSSSSHTQFLPRGAGWEGAHCFKSTCESRPPTAPFNQGRSRPVHRTAASVSGCRGWCELKKT